MVKVFAFLVLSCCLLNGCSSQKKITGSQKALLEKKLEHVLVQSARQYTLLQAATPLEDLPRTFEDGEIKTTTPDGWVSGFFPGTLLHLYQYTNDKALLNAALVRMKL